MEVERIAVCNKHCFGDQEGGRKKRKKTAKPTANSKAKYADLKVAATQAHQHLPA